MRSFRKKSLIVLLLLLCVLPLWGCGAKKVSLSSGDYPADTVQLTAVVSPEDLPLLDGFTALQSADFSGSSCYEEILAWAEAHPQVALRYTVPLPDGSLAENTATQLDLSGMDAAALEEALPLLAWLPALETVDLGSLLSPEAAQSCLAAYPELDFRFSFSFRGQTLDQQTASLDLSGLSHSDVEPLLPCLPMLTGLRRVELGSDEAEKHLDWADISAIHEACPEAELAYSFTLYGKSFTLADTSMDLRLIPIDDEGVLVKQIASCMPHLETLDMDSCGVSDESMAAIRDALPDTEVIWRIWFGDNYSVRTNVERILASNPGLGGELTGKNTECLKYCTKVKYLDLGHNTYMNSIDFVRYMPDLEVAILAMARWKDVSPLASCPKLEYLEIQTAAFSDLSPLSTLKNLRHLNICYSFSLHDLSPLYELPQLERLWIGMYTPVPPEQVEEMQKIAPNCVINTTTIDPTEGGWRYLGHDEFGYAQLDPRYKLLTEQFNYAAQMGAYSYYWNDPLCGTKPPLPAEPPAA